MLVLYTLAEIPSLHALMAGQSTLSLAPQPNLLQATQIQPTLMEQNCHNDYAGMPPLDPMVEYHPRRGLIPSANAVLRSSVDHLPAALPSRAAAAAAVSSSSRSTSPSRWSSRLAGKTSTPRKRPVAASTSEAPTGTTSSVSAAKKRRVSLKKPPPNAKKESDYDEEALENSIQVMMMTKTHSFPAS